jgi:hypothetical protein
MCSDKTKLDYEKFIKEKWKENAEDVPNILVKNDSNIAQQVKTYSHRFDEPKENIRVLENLYCASCMINNFNENCWAILELVEEVGVDKICEVYEDRGDIELLKKNFTKRIGSNLCI